MAVTEVIADMEITDNATWLDAFIFGTEGDLSWSFTNQSFRMDLKFRRLDPTPVLSLTSSGGSIVVYDQVQRILGFNVPEATIQSSFPTIPGTYLYDLVMFDSSNPSVRTLLLSGKVKVVHGITGG